MNLVALISARGGSKRLPGKHLADVAGTPLIGHAIGYALKSTPTVFVSTDCGKIATVAESYGATAIQRPARLAQDDSTFADAVFHAVDQLHALPWDHLVTLEGSTVIRRAGLIEDSFAKLQAVGADHTTTVIRCSGRHPDWTGEMDADGVLRPLVSMQSNSQQLRPLWHLQESVQVFTRRAIEQADRSAAVLMQAGHRTVGVEIGETDILHIDDAADLEFARMALGGEIVRYPA